MSEHLPLCVVSSHVWDLVVKNLPFQPGFTFKPGRQVHKDSTTAGISNHNIYYQLYHAPLMCPVQRYASQAAAGEVRQNTLVSWHLWRFLGTGLDKEGGREVKCV